MYTPAHFAMSDEQAHALVRSAESAQLVTAHDDGPQASLLPVAWREGGGPHGTLITHVTRVNPVWKRERHGEALAILSGPDAFMDPTWHPSHADLPGVPTWDYVTVHAYGPLVVCEDPDVILARALELSDRFGFDSRVVGASRLERMARAIVGIEMPIARIEAKAKVHQNRSPEDILGAVAGLRAVGEDALADALEEQALPHARARFALIEDVRQRRPDAAPSMD